MTSDLTSGRYKYEPQDILEGYQVLRITPVIEKYNKDGWVACVINH